MQVAVSINGTFLHNVRISSFQSESGFFVPLTQTTAPMISYVRQRLRSAFRVVSIQRFQLLSARQSERLLLL